MPPVGYLVNVAGGVLVAALGIVVGRLRPRGAANVTFGLWAFAFGGGFALSNVPYLAGQSPEEYYARGGLAYVAGALVVMLLAAASILFVRLGLIVPGPLPKGSRRILVLPLAVLAADVVVTTASAADKGPALAVAAAAWGAAMGSLWAVLVLLALRFDAEPGPGGRARIQIGLVSAATLVWIGLISGALARATPSDPPESAIVVAAGRVGLAAALLVSGLWLRNLARGGGRLARNLAWLAVATPLLGLALNVFFGGGIAVDAAGTAGIARLAMAAILAYAILRHQLFDLDVKVKWTLRRGTLAAMFLAVFFVVAQVAQTFLTDALGLVVGGMAAGLLLFAIAPLQRMAERVADVAMPGVRDPRERAVALGADEAYREALRMALEDGVITPAEERSLARMARQLGIDPERALDLRDEVRGVLGA